MHWYWFSVRVGRRCLESVASGQPEIHHVQSAEETCRFSRQTVARRDVSLRPRLCDEFLGTKFTGLFSGRLWSSWVCGIRVFIGDFGMQRMLQIDIISALNVRVQEL